MNFVTQYGKQFTMCLNTKVYILALILARNQIHLRLFPNRIMLYNEKNALF